MTALRLRRAVRIVEAPPPPAGACSRVQKILNRRQEPPTATDALGVLLFGSLEARERPEGPRLWVVCVPGTGTPPGPPWGQPRRALPSVSVGAPPPPPPCLEQASSPVSRARRGPRPPPVCAKVSADRCDQSGTPAACCGWCRDHPRGSAAGLDWRLLPGGSASFSPATLWAPGGQGLCEAHWQLSAQLMLQPLGVAGACLVSRRRGAPAGSVAPCCGAELTSRGCWTSTI